MKYIKKVTLRVYLLIVFFSLFIPETLANLLFNNKPSKPLYILLFALVSIVIPVFILVMIFSDLYYILKSFDIRKYHSPESIVLKWAIKLLGVGSIFSYLERLIHKQRLLDLENQILFNSSRAFQVSFNLNQVMDTALSSIKSNINADYGLIYLLKDDVLKLTSIFNVSLKDIKKATFDLGDGLVGLAAKADEAFLAKDVERDPIYSFLAPSTKACLVIPLRCNGRVNGVMIMGSFNTSAFGSKELFLLKDLSSKFGLAIKNMQLAEKLKKDKELSDILYDTTSNLAQRSKLSDVINISVKTVRDLTKADSCSIMQYNETEGVLKIIASLGVPRNIVQKVKVRPGEGLAGKAFQEQKTVMDEQKDTSKVSYAIPMLTPDGCIGTINISTENPLSEEKCKILDSIAFHISTAIKHALLFKSMEELATRDSLTGLYNHRYFQQTIAREVERASRYDRPLSLVILDIDNFKKYNDYYGHMLGDYLLKEIGQVIKSNLRKSDVLARYGGDELALILPETESKSAYMLLERIRKQIAQFSLITPQAASAWDLEKTTDETTSREVLLKNSLLKTFRHWLNKMHINPKIIKQHPPANVTISAGICSLSKAVTDKDDLIKKADQALLKAKRIGKNQICIYS